MGGGDEVDFSNCKTVKEVITEDLREACEETDPAMRQLLALQAVHSPLGEIGICEEALGEDLLAPLREMFSDIMNAYLKRKHGGAVRSLEKIQQLAHAAACVTVLNKDRGFGVRDAVRDTAKRYGLKRGTLQEFYDDLHRHRRSRTIPHARLLYDYFCRAIRWEIEWQASPSADATRRLIDYIDERQARPATADIASLVDYRKRRNQNKDG